MAQAVLVELVIQQPLGIVRVMKERQRAAPTPFLDALRRQQMMSRLREHDGRRHQHQAIHARAGSARERAFGEIEPTEAVLAQSRMARERARQLRVRSERARAKRARTES